MSVVPLILVIDDDLDLRQAVCEALEESGYVTVGAADGAAALAFLRNGSAKPGLILLDLMMPGMNGWEFRQEQTRDAELASIPVVVMTARRDVTELRADAIVYKPIKLKKLLEVVQQHARGAPAVAPSHPEAQAAPPRSEVDLVLQGGGELGRRMREIDWSLTSLGPVQTWPQSLRTCLRIILTSRQPMFVWWGDELINLYNDAYRSIVGGKHPQALGQPARLVWAEIWDEVGPRAESAMRANEGTYDEALLLIMERHGYQEETYYTFSYSPVPNDEGGIGGILCANTDDTERIIGERQLALLRELAARTTDARTREQACHLAALSLASNPKDLPFALLYLWDVDAAEFALAGAAGIAAGTPVSPERVAQGSLSGWPLDEARRSNGVVLLDDLESRFSNLPTGGWQRPPHQAALFSITPAGASGSGVLVVGLNPFRLFDERYRRFLELLSGQVASGIASAQAHEAEKKRAEALAELDRAKTMFFSNVSHEFRTPLTLMLGPIADMLRGLHGELASGPREQLEILQRNGLRLQKLVNALLDFSRLEAGRVQASYEPVELSTLTGDLASAFKPAIERAGLRFVVDCPPLPAPVYVDCDMWERIVLNLLSNALKFTFEGCIEVALYRADGAVELRVRDTGVGIPEAELPRVFERFHRVEGVQGRTHEGSGVGLALVHELTKLHGGTVRVQSEAGVGTTFTVSIPLGKAHLPRERVESERPRAAPSVSGTAFVEEALSWLPRTQPQGAEDALAPRRSAEDDSMAAGTGSARILLADDNADMRDYVRRHLQRVWTVEAVADGAQALASARENPPDLILTDIMMPGMDGFELLRELRKDARTARIPVVMLSARAGEEARVEGLHAGAEDYLTKPFSERELLARVRTHLDLARLRRAVEEERDRLQSLLGQVPAIVNFFRGEELVFEFVHPLARRLVGDRELQGKPLLQAVPAMRDQEFPALLRKVLQTGRLVEGREKPLRLDFEGDGQASESYWDYTYVPIRDSRGRVEGVMTFHIEVTAQVLARRGLEESEERFRNMADNAPVMVWITDVAASCTYLSKSWYALTGQTPQTGLGVGWLEAVHPADRVPSKQVFGAAHAKREPFVLEYRLRRKDGAYRWAIDSASPRMGPSGEFLGYIGSVIDITERKTAELALQASEARVRELLRSERQAREEAESLVRVAESFAEAELDLETVVQRLTDHGTRLVGAQFGAFFYNVTNEAGESYVLYTLSGAPKEAFERFGLPRNTPLFDITFGGKAVARIDDVKKDPRYGQMAPHHGMPSGHLPVTSYLAVPVKSQTGTVLGGLFFGHPQPAAFTEQHERIVVALAQSAAIAMDNARLYQTARASEARYRAMFEATAVSFWEEDFTAVQAMIGDLKRAHGSELRAFLQAHPEVVADALGKVRVVDVNPPTLRMLGATSKEEALQSLPRIFLPEAYVVFIEELMAIAEGRRVVSADTAIQTLSGQRIDVAFGVAFPPPGESYERVLVTLTDISQGKMAAREREARMAEMERAVHFSEMFVGIVGHDLRNPLSAITTAANLLELRAESETIARPVSRILTSAVRMERMISQLLDLTRIRLGGGLPLERTRVDLAQLSRVAVEELEPVFERAIGIEATGDVSGDWDGDRLSQLLSNLLGNACQHGTKDHAVVIELDGSRAGFVHLEVRNRGVIAPEILPVVFEPLRSTKGQVSRDRPSGLGLGLYITQQIVLAHGGQIRVESSEEHGTRFLVDLPRQATVAELPQRTAPHD